MVAVSMWPLVVLEVDVASCLHCEIRTEVPMAVTTISSRQFNQDVSQAKRAAQEGPVVITDRGEPAFVLLRHEAYRQLVGQGPSIRDLLAQPGAAADFEFEPPRLGGGLFRTPDLS
jgi:prevent-host-death family protein